MSWTSRRSGRSAAFTLVELLVVIGIIALLISILLPSLSRARQSAKDLQCASNMRQLGMAFVQYAIDNEGRYPTNFTQVNELNFLMGWYDQEQIGRYLPNEVVTPTGAIGGNVMRCSSDQEDVARAYTMNIWASGDLEAYVRAGNSWLTAPSAKTGLPRGELWNNNVSDSANMIILAEKWAQWPSAGEYFTNATLGYPGHVPSERFVELDPPVQTRVGSGISAPTEIDYTRHRRSENPPSQINPGQAFGQANFAFADGHVEMVQVTDMADPDQMISRRKAMWSPLDLDLIEWEAENPASDGSR